MTDEILIRVQKMIDDFAGGNRSEFARRTGKKPSHITDICKGRTSLTMPYLVTLRELFHINLHWLLLGEGPMVDNSTLAEESFIYVPLYDVQASAGYGMVIHSEQIVDYLAFKQQWLKQDLGIIPSHLVLITIKGDSMLPTLNEKDLVLVDLTQNQFNREGIYLIQFEGALIVKRLQRDYEQNFHVISDNKLYKEFIITALQKSSVQIIGKVVWFGRKI